MGVSNVDAMKGDSLHGSEYNGTRKGVQGQAIGVLGYGLGRTALSGVGLGKETAYTATEPWF